VGASEVIDTLLAITGFMITAIAGWFVLEFREMRKSVEELNIKISKIIDRMEAHEERIDQLEKKLHHR
jgi:phage regulator Rha-like protein